MHFGGSHYVWEFLQHTLLNRMMNNYSSFKFRMCFEESRSVVFDCRYAEFGLFPDHGLRYCPGYRLRYCRNCRFRCCRDVSASMSGSS